MGSGLFKALFRNMAALVLVAYFSQVGNLGEERIKSGTPHETVVRSGVSSRGNGHSSGPPGHRKCWARPEQPGCLGCPRLLVVIGCQAAAPFPLPLATAAAPEVGVAREGGTSRA